MPAADLQYLMWIKNKLIGARDRDVINLATSGVITDHATRWLQDTITTRGNDVIARLEEPSQFGLILLKEAIRAAYRVDADREIVCTSGASGAIRLICEALLAGRCDVEMVVESPVYEPLRAIPARFGATIVEAERTNLIASVVKAVSHRTTAVFLTNPHNPTGSWLDEGQLAELADAVERHNPKCLVVVDETYCDVGPAPGTTSSNIDRRLVTLSSLSKSYGLPALCCGWIIADRATWPNLMEDMVLFQNIGGKVAEILGAFAFERLDELRGAARRHLERNRELVSAWIKEMADQSIIEPQPVPNSCVIFPCVRIAGFSAQHVERLESQFGVLVTPGHFFGSEYGDHMRIGFGGDSRALQRGLAKLADGLSAMQRAG